MKILLTRPNSDLYSAPIPLGMMYLSSYLKKRDDSHEIKLVDWRSKNISDERLYFRQLADYLPDIVGISALHWDAKNCKRLATLAKKARKDTIVIIGGPFPSSDYKSCLSHPDIDCAVVGEGEETFFELVKALESGRSFEGIKGAAYRSVGSIVYNGPRETIKDLDTIPYPDYGLFDIDQYFYGAKPGIGNQIPWKRRAVNVVTSRGCPYRCTYCHNIFGRSIQFRTVKNVLSEIAFLKERYGIEEVEFADDCFNLDVPRAKEILQGLTDSGMKLKLSFPNGLRVDRIDEEYIDIMKRSGVYKVAVAIESASPRIQAMTKKELDLAKARQIIKSLVKKGIHTVGFFIIGFPGETREEIQCTIDYALSTVLHSASFHILTPFPGTEIWNQAKMDDRGVASDNIYSHYERISVNLSAVSDEELYGLKKMAHRKFFLDAERIFRLLKVVYNKRNVFNNMPRHLALFVGTPEQKRDPLRLFRPLFYKISKFITAAIVKLLFFKVTVTGSENIPKDGAFIIASNHIGHLDPYIFTLIFSKQLYYMAKPNKLFLKFLGGVDAMDSIMTTGPSAVKEAIRRIEDNKPLVFFPEGERNESGGPMEFKAGAAFVALKTKAKVLPVKITGTDKALNYRTFRIKPGVSISVSIGEPLSFDSSHIAGSLNAQAKEAMRLIVDKISQL